MRIILSLHQCWGKVTGVAVPPRKVSNKSPVSSVMLSPRTSGVAARLDVQASRVWAISTGVMDQRTNAVATFKKISDLLRLRHIAASNRLWHRLPPQQ